MEITEQNRVQVAMMASMVGATVAYATGRAHTKFDNFVVGGAFTGFAAYRDPRATLLGTLLVAAVEGAIWGATDRIVPHIKDRILPPPELKKGIVPESARAPQLAPAAGW
jgi:hypothetical protein